MSTIAEVKALAKKVGSPETDLETCELLAAIEALPDESAGLRLKSARARVAQLEEALEKCSMRVWDSTAVGLRDTMRDALKASPSDWLKQHAAEVRRAAIEEMRAAACLCDRPGVVQFDGLSCPPGSCGVCKNARALADTTKGG